MVFIVNSDTLQGKALQETWLDLEAGRASALITYEEGECA